MAVYKYTKELQALLQSKTKSEPWLHCIIERFPDGFVFIIFVWDTRKAIENGIMPFKPTAKNDLKATLKRAPDPGTPLQGLHGAVLDRHYKHALLKHINTKHPDWSSVKDKANKMKITGKMLTNSHWLNK